MADVAQMASIVTAIASIAISFLLLMLYLRIYKHSRCSKAVEMMQFFIQESKPMLDSGIQYFGEKLNKEQSEAIQQGHSLRLNEDLEPLVRRCLCDSDSALDIKRSNGSIEVPAEVAKKLRVQLSRYLNLLEIVATTWRHGIADREIIEEEFKSIISKNTHTFVMEDFRKATGIYPSIREMCDEMERKIKKSAKNKNL